MKPLASKYDVSVIVGRFQTPELTDAHRDLIDTVVAQHDRVLLFLGAALTKLTANNPLDVSARRKMIEKAYPDGIVEVYYVEDVPDNDEAWSTNLDREISRVLGPAGDSVVLYGGRDSFIRDPKTDEPIYVGRFPTQELECDADADWGAMSGTKLRKKASVQVGSTAEFRKGICYASVNRYINPQPTIDAAVFSDNGDKILLGRKKYEAAWRFFGGFLDHGETLEAAVRREVQEEAGISVTDPQYVFSQPVDDPRYRNEKDSITTTMFRCTVMFGNAQAGDDIEEVRWFDVDKVSESTFAPVHQPLWRTLADKLDLNH